MGVISNTDATRSQTFGYDALNRIATGSSVATSGTNCWAEKFGYDTWGNLTSMSALAGFTGCTEPDHLSVTMTTANQISGYTYDASGNLTVIPGTGGATYTYNGESELTTTTAGVNYTYDGEGQRVEKSNGTLFWYGMGGEVLEETGLTGGFMEDYVFFGGQRVARMDSSKDIFAYFEDHLGTAREMQKIVPGASTATLVYDADFRPYGRESILTQTGNPLYKFDGKRRDTESGLDDFGARYYSFTIGRFMSADWSAVPAPVPYANLTNPQTLNLYAMVSDNPETFADLDGHSAEGATEQSDTLAEDGQPSDCAELEGCAEYELQISDGDNDTATEENNAAARNDATVDGTTNQTKTTQTTFTYTDSADQVSVLQQTTTTTTTDAHGNVTTTETSTTLFFSTAQGHEGEFVSGTQRSTMNVRDSQGHTTPFGTDQAKLDAGSAQAAVGDAAFARGRSAAIPSAATRYAQNHKGALIMSAAELPLAPLRFATEGYQVAKEIVEGILALHTVWELAH